MDKATFLQRMEHSRLELETAIARLSNEEVLQPGASGEMSVKDMLVHITWHEQQMIGVIEHMALAGSPWWGLPTDERNALIFAANRERGWQDVLSEAQTVYPRLLGLLEGLAETAYQDPSLYREMPADWAPWVVFAGNTFEHYEHHLRDMQDG